MSDLNAAIENEISAMIALLTKSRHSARFFYKTQALMDKRDQESAKLIPHRIFRYVLESIDSATPAELYIRFYMCASSFAIQSQRDLEEGKSSDALYHLRQASYFFGRAISSVTNVEENEENNVIDSMAERIREGGSTGGKNKDKNLKPIRQKAAELLSTLKPEGGWSSKLDAAEKIADGLNAFIKEYRSNNPDKKINISRSEDRRIDLILDWMSDQQIVRDAYIANASQKALNRLKNKNLKKLSDVPESPSDEP